MYAGRDNGANCRARRVMPLTPVSDAIAEAGVSLRQRDILARDVRAALLTF